MEKIEFTYASRTEHNIAQRLIIQTIEKITGKKKLENLYQEYKHNSNDPVNFWQDIISLMKINIVNKSRNALNIPKDGSLIVIANHPFGIVDGLILCSLVSKSRSDFKIMTHETLQFLPQLKKFILPVDFSAKNKESKRFNLATAKLAKNHLKDNGALIIFPAGSVSTAQTLRSDATDEEWKLFPAKLIHSTKASVLPIFFDGKNGVFFHLFASKFKNQTLKYSTYIHETKKKIGKDIIIYSGKTLKYNELSHMKDRKCLTNYLKETTYKLKTNDEQYK